MVLSPIVPFTHLQQFQILRNVLYRTDCRGLSESWPWHGYKHYKKMLKGWRKLCFSEEPGSISPSFHLPSCSDFRFYGMFYIEKKTDSRGLRESWPWHGYKHYTKGWTKWFSLKCLVLLVHRSINPFAAITDTECLISNSDCKTWAKLTVSLFLTTISAKMFS